MAVTIARTVRPSPEWQDTLIRIRTGQRVVIDTEDVPVAQLIRKEMRGRLRDAMGKLPEDQRRVLELRLKGVEAPEIAEKLGIKANAVRKRESRAVSRLRGILQEERPSGSAEGEPS